MARPTGRRTRRAGAVLAACLGALGLAALCLLGVAAPARADSHAAMGPDAQFYVSTITSVTPKVAGLVVSVARTGQTVTVTNGTGRTVEVTGVTGEPFLRLGPGGVDENTSSLTARLNAVRTPGAPLPQQTGAVQPVTWKHVSDGTSYSWSDHRTHWMSLSRPPQVAADPKHPHPVSTWTIALTADGTPVTVAGTLAWAGDTGSAGRYAPFVVGGLVVVALAAAGLAVRRSVRPADPASRPRTPASVR